MYKNYLFDLYGTLADIHTDEEKPDLWEKLSLFLAMKDVYYEPKKLMNRYVTLVKQQEQKLIKENPSLAAPEIDIAPVFSQFFTDQGKEASSMEIADLARIFRCLSLEHLYLFDGVIDLMNKLKANHKKVYLLSNAQALFTRPELSLLKLVSYFDGILLSSEAGVKKPDPAFYNALLDKYHLKAEESVMIGNDDIADCHGAAGVGLDSAYLCTPQSPSKTRPLPRNCRELPDISAVSELILTPKKP